MIDNIKHNQTKEKVFSLARKFIEEGLTKENKEQYQMLDTQTTQAALAAANDAAKRKYGYMRNGELTNCGRMVILYKMALDGKVKRAPPTAALERRALALKVPLSRVNETTCRDIHKEVRKRRAELWDTPKRCEAGRVDWLEAEVKKRTQAAGDNNWEKNLS